MSHSALRRSFAALVLAVSTIAQTQDFAEVYALAADRGAVLDQLVPGTEDFYYYQCLHRLQTGRLEEVPALADTWVSIYGRDARTTLIQHHHALLKFGDDPTATYEYLQQQFELRFSQERDTTGRRSDLPAELDPALLSPARLRELALARHAQSLDGFGDRALPALAVSALDDWQLLAFLQRVGRLGRADLPNLPALIARQLALPGQGRFGALDVHRQLTLAQLDELLALRPPLLTEAKFVDSYARRLLPAAGVPWQDDPLERGAYLERLWQLAQRLAPTHNGFKNHVLHHCLLHDLARGTLDRQRFMAFLRLPRRSDFVNADFLERARPAELVEEGGAYGTSLPAEGPAEELARRCFEVVFQTEVDTAPYAQFVSEHWLRRVLAETRLLLDPAADTAADRERWYAMLDDPIAYQRLVDRIELSFAPQQPLHFDAAAPVAIALDVKNVRTLLVKTYRVDAYAYGRSTGREVDASIDLDGVEANSERVLTYDEPPLRRVRRSFTFPELRGVGTWVVEFVGNGISSRAVVQKGRLHALERIGAAGHAFTVVDEQGQLVADAVAHVAGSEYRANEQGEIVVPFAPQATQRTLLLGHGTLASTQPFAHLAEDYALAASVFVDREQLLAGGRARLIVRPQLSVNDAAIDPNLLQDAVLEIKATDRHGTDTLQTLRPIAWEPGNEYVHVFSVPKDLASLTVSLRGRVDKLSEGRPVDLAAAPAVFQVNHIDKTAMIPAPLLGRDQEGWFLEVRGRTGEPIAGHVVPLMLWHRDYADLVQVELASGDDGRIRLGAMPGVQAAWMPLPDATDWSRLPWRLDNDAVTTPTALAGVVGEALRVPYVTPQSSTGAPWRSLVELRGGAPYRDATASIAVVPGFLELRGLSAGDYLLRLDAEREVAVRVTAGRVERGWAIGPDRALPLSGRARLQVLEVAVGADEVVVRLANAGDDAHLHVFATRYLPGFDAAARLALPTRDDRGREVVLGDGACSYSAGRQLADELRYVLERRYATKYPGNMLTRPSLLLNPWHPTDDARSWEAQQGHGGPMVGGAGGRSGGRGTKGGAIGADGGGTTASAFANLDFLPRPSSTLANLRPDGDGVVRIRRADLGDGQHLHVVAIDDDDTAQRSVVLPAAPLQPRDLTLQTGLDPAGHFAEQRRIEFLRPGGEAVIGAAGTARYETFATLGDVFGVLNALVQQLPEAPPTDLGSGAAPTDLGKFEFLVRWPDLGDDERRALYREHACHELHLFLYFKDRPYFDAVLRPYLADKLEQTFVDHWLLGDDLDGYLQPWAFAQLNLVERILLLRRLPGRGDDLARYVAELAQLQRVSAQRDQALFLAALDSRALAFDDQARFQLGDLTPDRSAAPQPPATSAAPEVSARLRLGRELQEKKADLEADAAEDFSGAPANEPVHDALVESRRELQDRDLALRGRLKALWRAPDPTLRHIERNYWATPRAAEISGLVAASDFWRDFAAHDPATPFVSEHFAQACGSVTEALLALAVLDLPFAAEAPSADLADDRLTLRPRTPLLLARSELLATAAAPDTDPVLVRQDHFRLDDRFVVSDGRQRTKYVRDEFLTGVGYGCQVVVTNPTSMPRRVELLLQIPHGAMPLQGAMPTRSVPIELAAFATATAGYAYYFPTTGEHRHFPAHVTGEGAFLAAAEPLALRAVAVPTSIDTTSWAHVSQDGSEASVLQFLADANLQQTDLSRIEWRMRGRAFFGQVTALLRQRFVYHAGIWSFSVLHQDPTTAAEYLANQAAFVAQCGPVLRSPLLDVDPFERRTYEHAEFMPLHHSRSHQIGPWRRIANADVARQWREFLGVLAATARPDAVDLVSATYFLLLQNRVEEALQMFARVDPDRLAARLQYDYLAAYLGFFTGDIGRARELATRHRDHPVARWRLLFREVLQHIDEAFGGAVAATDPRARDQQQDALAARAPMLDVAVADDRVVLRHANVTSCEVRYHLLDVEFAFSTSPFAQQGAAAVAWVEPRRKDVVSLSSDAKETVVPLPEKFRRGNVVVEVRADGIARRATHLASAMTLHTMESYGQLQVSRATGGPLPKAYVKVFARLPDGQVRFHKDGYTDLRGRFDYASVPETGTGGAERFAILVLSEADGAVIREVTPPGS